MGGWCGLERPVESMLTNRWVHGHPASRSCPISESSETSGVLAITSSRRQMGQNVPRRTGERGYPRPRPSHFTGGDYLAHFDLRRQEEHLATADSGGRCFRLILGLEKPKWPAIRLLSQALGERSDNVGLT